MRTEKRLYSEKLKITKEYRYKINNFGAISEPSVCGLDEVLIVFVDNEFEYCKFPFSGHYTKPQWEVLEAISLKIRELMIGHAKEKQNKIDKQEGKR